MKAKTNKKQQAPVNTFETEDVPKNTKATIKSSIEAVCSFIIAFRNHWKLSLLLSEIVGW